MKNYFIFIACVILMFEAIYPPRLSAEPVADDLSKSMPVAAALESFSPTRLKDHLALGVVIANPIYLANLRWWFEDKTALDLYLGGNYYENYGVDFNNKPITLPSWIWGFGLGLRENIAHPVEGVWVQAIEKITYDAASNQYGYTSEIDINQFQDLNAYLGMGFEAFVPFWKNLSVEGSVGIQAGIHWNQQKETINGHGGPNPVYEKGFSNWTAGITNNIPGLFNAAAHFYF